MYTSFDLEKIRSENRRYSSRAPFEHQKDAFEKLSQLLHLQIMNTSLEFLFCLQGLEKRLPQ